MRKRICHVNDTPLPHPPHLSCVQINGREKDRGRHDSVEVWVEQERSYQKNEQS